MKVLQDSSLMYSIRRIINTSWELRLWSKSYKFSDILVSKSSCSNYDSFVNIEHAFSFNADKLQLFSFTAKC